MSHKNTSVKTYEYSCIFVREGHGLRVEGGAFVRCELANEDAHAGGGAIQILVGIGLCTEANMYVRW